ncbi:hypothetical protein [Paraburkholderia sediminicola]|uniref:hypothetical protein n=1 Tax=Paraburkholderia sediminicola TaxID=458836 RepID=UPI0038BBC551
MTEARVFTAMMVVCALIALACGITHQWLGVIGSLLGVLNAWSARWFLVRWKPSSKVE